MKKFIKNWWLIILLLITLCIIYLLNVNFSNVSLEISGGLMIEIMGAIITFLLIDRVLKNNEENKRIRIEKAALKGFKFTLKDLLNMFWRMRRAAAKVALEKPPLNWHEAILSDKAIDDYRHLDFLSDAGIHPPLTWNNYVAQYFREKFLPAFRNIIDSYSIFLSPELIEKLEALNSSELFSRIFLQSAHFSSLPEGPKKIPILYEMENYLRKTINDLIDLTNMYNKLCPDDPIIFEGLNLSENSKPLLGTGRIEINKNGTYN